MKVLNAIFTVVFILFAALQYNDADPYVWIPIYLFAAYLCYRAARQRFSLKLYLIAYLVYGFYGLYLLLDKTGVLYWATERRAEDIAATMQATKPWIEETREFFGLVIILVVLTINVYWLHVKNRAIKGIPLTS